MLYSRALSAAAAAQRAAQLVVLDQLADRLCQRVDVLVRHEQAVAVVVDDVARPGRAVVARHRQALAHRLDQDQRKALEARAEHEDRGGTELGAHVLRRAGELHGVAHAVALDQLLQLGLLVALAADPQRPVAVVAGHLRPRGDQQVEALLARQPAGREHDLAVHVRVRPAHRVDRVRDPLEPQPALHQPVVVRHVALGQRHEHVEPPVLARHRLAQALAPGGEVDLLEADRRQAGQAQVGGDHVQRRTRGDEEAGALAQRVGQLEVDPEVPPLDVAVGRMREHAAEAAHQRAHRPQRARRPLRPVVVERGDLHARREAAGEERVAAQPEDAQDLDLVALLGEVAGHVVGGADRAAHPPRAHEDDQDALVVAGSAARCGGGVAVEGAAEQANARTLDPEGERLHRRRELPVCGLLALASSREHLDY